MSKNSSQRLFIALCLPEETKNYINNYVSSIKTDFTGVKWEPKEKFHITLRFLGEVKEEKYLLLSKSLDEQIKNIKAPKLKIEKFSAFPNFKKPRVLVVTFKKDNNLGKIYESVNSVCGDMGLVSEKRKFIPHITVGRVKKNYEMIKKSQDIESRDYLISKIAIIRSELTSKGSNYSNLRVWELK